MVLILLLFAPLLPLSEQVAADGHWTIGDHGDTADLQAHDILVVFDNQYEQTRIMWRNVGTSNIAQLQDLQTAEYSIYRHDSEINASVVENESLIPIATVPACTTTLVGCQGLQHEYTYALPPSVNGSFFYGISTECTGCSEGNWLNVTRIHHFERSVSNVYDPIIESTHAITAPFLLSGEYDVARGMSELTWVNLNTILPGSIPDNGYAIKVYKHENKANRSIWPMLGAELLTMLPPSTTYYEHPVAEETDGDSYYSVTYQLQSDMYEDLRFIESNTLEVPIHEDNVPPGNVTTISAQFTPTAEEGTGVTSVFWDDIAGESGETYHIWRSGAPFDNTSHPDVVAIGTSVEGNERFDYELERGTIGFSYYGVTVSDALGNHENNISATAITGQISEDTFSPWVAEPTDVQAVYIGNGQTTITWTDQLGVEGEIYHVWFSEGIQLTASSNVSRDATLIDSVPDGVQTATATIPMNVARKSYYCVTTEARYHTNATYEDFRFQQNCAAPVDEDTLAPSATLLSTPSLHVQGDSKFILFQWLNNINENDESYTLYRHAGEPWENDTTSGQISIDDGWEVVLGPIAAPENTEPSMMRQRYLEDNVDSEAWYALTVTDLWGNENTAATAPGNAYLVREDTTPATATVHVESEDEDGETIIVQSLNEGEYEMIFTVDETLSEHPIINVTTSDISYDPETGAVVAGYAFTDQISTVRADPVQNKENTYRLRMTVPSGLETTPLNVEYTLFDSVGNVATEFLSNWTIDSVSPMITLYAPSSTSTYLYGEYVRVHGAVVDDVGIMEVRLKFEKGLDSYPTTKTEWFTVNDLTTMDGDGRTMVFEWSDPAASWPVKGAQLVTIEATDLAGNREQMSVIFQVDLCQRTSSGMTICSTEVDELKPQDLDFDGIPDTMDECPDTPDGEIVGADGCAPAGPFSGTYLLVYTVGGINILLLFVAIISAILAGRDPAKRHSRGDEEEMTEEDDWMMEFMGSTSDDAGSADDVRADLAALNEDEEEEEEEEEEEDDLFGEKISRPARRRRKSSDDDDSDQDSRRGVQRRAAKRRGE